MLKRLSSVLAICSDLAFVQAAAQESEELKLTVKSGAQWRAQAWYLDRYKRFKEAGMGDPVALYAYLEGTPALNSNSFPEAMAVAETTMTCIMGHEGAHSGGKITWDMMMAAKQDFLPKPFDYKDSVPVPPLVVPGAYEFV